ncbi:hypothetical protein OUZ56_004711 [Daphnia magna]|uniref:Uncharacterized protein n=1 Tax=Daphnia magna TaxID=35525 RepID=A0ABQ9YQM8_9CRUS|nr:hypothetical protein OUZ56_004711 [Daphnia magna]
MLSGKQLMLLVGLSKTTSLQSFAIRCIVKGCTRSRLTNNDARVNIKEKQLLVSGKVCDKHFILGKPSYERDISNPDWAPTLLLENNEQFSANRCQRRYIRRQARALLDISAWFTRKGIICFEELSRKRSCCSRYKVLSDRRRRWNIITTKTMSSLLLSGSATDVGL